VTISFVGEDHATGTGGADCSGLGLSDGDLLYGLVVTGSGSPGTVFNAPNGSSAWWNALGSGISFTSRYQTNLFWRRWSSGDPTSYGWETATPNLVQVAAYRGALPLDMKPAHLGGAQANTNDVLTVGGDANVAGGAEALLVFYLVTEATTGGPEWDSNLNSRGSVCSDGSYQCAWADEIIGEPGAAWPLRTGRWTVSGRQLLAYSPPEYPMA